MFSFARAFFASLYLGRRTYGALVAVALLFVVGFFAPVAAAVARVALVGVGVLLVVDGLLLYRQRGVRAGRSMPERLSNGDDNVLEVVLRNDYPFALHADVVDELPVEFQARNASHALRVGPGGERTVRYVVRPVRRGAYTFGALNVYAATPLGLLQRRYRLEQTRTVPVYPSYQQMRAYELLAASDRLTEAGVKRIRQLGHTMEFDHIREYVVGDDPRSINWKATARRHDLMVNQYREERGQPVYCVLDAGRVMRMPFEEMTLLDWSINASLVLANVALRKRDRAGLMVFAHEIGRVVPAARTQRQIYAIQEALYNVETDFLESDHQRLAAFVRRRMVQRGLLLLFTNFETRTSMRRQLPYLRALGRHHTVVVVFFENTAVHGLLEGEPGDTEGIYVKAMAESFVQEKRAIVRELRQHGLHAVLTPPQELTARTLNKYLELKARGLV